MLAHVHALVDRMRPEDIESARLAGVPPLQVYWTMVARSPHCATALLDGVPAAMWGAAVESYVAAESAHLWLWIAGDVQRPAHLIARGALPFVEQMQAIYGRLTTTVAWGHERDHRWVRWLGFERAPAQDQKIGAGAFLAYERR